MKRKGNIFKLVVVVAVVVAVLGLAAAEGKNGDTRGGVSPETTTCLV